MTKKYLVGLFALATLLDLVSTILCLEAKVSYESNPVVAYILNNAGYIGFTLAKISAVLFFYALITYAKRSVTISAGWVVTWITLTVALLNFSLLI